MEAEGGGALEVGWGGVVWGGVAGMVGFKGKDGVGVGVEFDISVKKMKKLSLISAKIFPFSL